MTSERLKSGKSTANKTKINTNQKNDEESITEIDEMKLEELQALYKKHTEYNSDERIISFEDNVKEIREGFVQKLRFSSGFNSLDARTDKFEKGELVLVSGMPKSGKSLLLRTFTKHFAEQGGKICWFSFEYSPWQFYTQFPELRMVYMPRKMKLANLGWLEKMMLESKIKYDTQIFCIDHLHYLVDQAENRNVNYTTGSVLRKLKFMAVKYDVLIFITAHSDIIRPDIEKVEFKESGIRDSVFCLQEPDTILAIWRLYQGENDRCSDLRVIASRRTGARDVTLCIYKNKRGWLEETGLLSVY